MRILKINSLPSIKEAPWQDRDFVMLHACFQLLEDWVEKENGLTEWAHEEYTEPMSILKGLYNWWKESKGTDLDYEGTTQEKLEKLVKLRSYLWT